LGVIDADYLFFGCLGQQAKHLFGGVSEVGRGLAQSGQDCPVRSISEGRFSKNTIQCGGKPFAAHLECSSQRASRSFL
jgi:hypothetical protein